MLLMVLSSEDFESVMEAYPEARRRIQKSAQSRSSHALELRQTERQTEHQTDATLAKAAAAAAGVVSPLMATPVCPPRRMSRSVAHKRGSVDGRFIQMYDRRRSCDVPGGREAAIGAAATLAAARQGAALPAVGSSATAAEGSLAARAGGVAPVLDGRVQGQLHTLTEQVAALHVKMDDLMEMRSQMSELMRMMAASGAISTSTPLADKNGAQPCPPPAHASLATASPAAQANARSSFPRLAGWGRHATTPAALSDSGSSHAS